MPKAGLPYLYPLNMAHVNYQEERQIGMKYTILKLIVIILANESMVTIGCQGDFIGRNRSCRPTTCQTPDSFKPPRYCLERNEKEWKKCLTNLNRPFSSTKRVRDAVNRPPYISMLSTDLVEDGATTLPEITAVISYSTSQYAYWIVNMTSSENENVAGDPYYYRLPDQRTVHLKPEHQNQEVNITMSYRGLEPCTNRCNLHGCYLYVFHLISLLPGYSAMTYYITVFNISKNVNLSKLSTSWKSSIAVSSATGTVLVVFEPIPARLLSPENVSYRIGIHKSPESYDTSPPVQSYETQRAATTYTHTFLGIDTGDYFVEVNCILYNQNLHPNPWSRSQPFSVPPIDGNHSREDLFLPGENVDIKADKKIDKTSKDFKIINSLSVVAALCVVILLTSGIYILRRKSSVRKSEYPNRHTSPFGTQNNFTQADETVQGRNLIETFEDRLLDFNK
ncbi:uncharacterized protein LOC117330541 [Pecten maximus]|uniref:uncharacterized protein LOC117330541 n=1 Tax=Pecten maximus TaxID=6579 RepID=UPI00145896D0|nr:uncharacterized protein LOC117330541 [Pecten maximus]